MKTLLSDIFWFHGAERLQSSDVSGHGRDGCEEK